jgi:hypothetical protein
MHIIRLVVLAIVMTSTGCSGGGAVAIPTGPPTSPTTLCEWNPLVNTGDAKCTPVISVSGAIFVKRTGQPTVYTTMNPAKDVWLTGGLTQPATVYKALMPVIRGVHAGGDTTEVDATWVSDTPERIEIASRGDSLVLKSSGLVKLTATYKSFTWSTYACARFVTGGVLPNYTYTGCEGVRVP